MSIEEKKTHTECSKAMLPIRDALEILSGKWKLPILISLMYGAKRFKQISKDVNGITDRMLSKELRDLEVNKLVKRTVYDTFPPTVEYTRTKHSESLDNLLNEMRVWGIEHRKIIMDK